MIEANPDLDPLALREILRLTSERKETLSSADGEGVEEGIWATSPELDPYWNRHFGWGMVDAHAAVESSLLNTDTENINTDLQTYIISTQTGIEITTITGHSWSRSGSVDRIEYSVDGKSWKQVNYLPSSNESIYIDWIISIGAKDLDYTGDHTVLIRALDSNSMHSISAHTDFFGYGQASESSEESLALLIVVGVLLLVGIAVLVYRKNFLNS